MMAMSGTLETVEGEVKRITHHNDQDMFTILRLQPAKGGLLVLKGKMPKFPEGMRIRVRGVRTSHEKYGEQIEVQDVEEAGFASKEHLVNFLSGKSFKKIGPSFAQKIVQLFGMDLPRIIDEEPAKLFDCGLPEPKVQSFLEQWASQRTLNLLISQLVKHGIDANSAVKVYKQFHDAALTIIQENPYRLVEIPGIGFVKADNLAIGRGLSPRSPYRVQAAVRYALEEGLFKSGHCYLPLSDLSRKSEKLLGEEVTGGDVTAAIDVLIGGEQIKVEGTRAYLMHIWIAERDVAYKLRSLMAAGSNLPEITDEFVQGYTKSSGITFAPEQEEAVLTALNSAVMVITGGPGTGKSTITKSICNILDTMGSEFALCAPTGRAAKRLTEATGAQAKTIHRLLDATREGTFRYGAANPLPYDCVLVDETSMVDLPLFRSLMAAMRPGMRLILVGDADQLPAVGPGNVLGDLINSAEIPVVRLKRVFRQKGNSDIVTVAHQILRGEMPDLPTPREAKGRTCMFISVSDTETLISYVQKMVSSVIPDQVGIPIEDIQVLTPMRSNGAGTYELNAALQKSLNPPEAGKDEIDVKPRILRVGDRVMQTRNNYDKDVFNGDMGKIAAIGDNEEGEKLVWIRYPDKTGLVDYARHEWDELVHANAITIHKSQGAEFPAVVIIAHQSQMNMMQRNLLYTALTRGKKLAVFIGVQEALAMAVSNVRTEPRNTTLAQRLSADTD